MIKAIQEYLRKRAERQAILDRDNVLTDNVVHKLIQENTVNIHDNSTNSNLFDCGDVDGTCD